MPLAPEHDMRICVLGSSHTASLKLGWDIVKDQFPAVDLVFFGSPGGTWRHLRVQNGTLVSTHDKLTKSIRFTSGGLHRIDPGDYDAFLLFGLVLRLPRLRQGVSQAVLQETMKDVAQKGLTVRMATRLRSVTGKKIWIAANPMTLAVGGDVEPGSYHAQGGLIAEMQSSFAVPDASFLPQPAETMGPDMRTLGHFGQGARRLRPVRGGTDDTEFRSYDEDDQKHTNGDYGRLWLLNNLPVIVRGHAG